MFGFYLIDFLFTQLFAPNIFKDGLARRFPSEENKKICTYSDSI